MDDLDSPVPASDLEIEIIVLLTFVGIVFVLAHLLATVAICAVISVFRYLTGRISAAIHSSGAIFHPVLSPSPPLALRI